ncbi:MAG: FAD-dependent oxidoreductase, partial [Bacteroidota bacterium]|nr:FAD-dependent oxidoreductase [Bacteroidota bacterium]
FYSTIGTKVTVIEFMDTILPVEDADVSKAMMMNYKKRGIEIMTNSSVEKVESKGGKSTVTIKTKKGTETKECDLVLSAAGVQTNLENLGLEEMGIKHDKGKIVVDDFYKTTAPDVYAIGDIVPDPALAHVASAEGIICVEAICGHHPQALNYGNIPGCTYTHPEVASVGLTEEQAKEKGYELRVGKFPFSASGKASASGHKDGFVKVIFDKKYGEWLGCHMIGEGVTDMIAEAVVARNLETTGMEVLKSVHPHPTMSEAVMEAVAQAYEECIHL